MTQQVYRDTAQPCCGQIQRPEVRPAIVGQQEDIIAFADLHNLTHADHADGSLRSCLLVASTDCRLLGDSAARVGSSLFDSNANGIDTESGGFAGCPAIMPIFRST